MKNIDKMPVDKYLKLMMEIELYVVKHQEQRDITFREISKKFYIKISDVQTICEDSDTLTWSIGYRTSAGYYESPYKGGLHNRIQ